ncbi:MAG: ATP-binding protein, partial [Cyclobacteriaceae bacterium]
MTLDLGGRNHAVSGPNGTGKSGIVDALEFALTGDVSRLTGVGRGNLSVSAHGPHVDYRTSPEDAFVEVGVRVGQGEPIVLVRRSVARSRDYSLDPEDVGVRKVIDGMKGRKEVALSRREIIRFVIAEPGKRAADVQALLKLDELEEIRKRLQRIAKSEEKARKDAAGAVERSKSDLCRAMAIEVADEQDVFVAANARRALLSLPPLVLGPDVALDDGLAEGTGSIDPPLERAQALRDLDAVETTVRLRTAAEFRASCAEARLQLERLRSSETLLAKVTRDTFYEMALEIFDGDACPACDTPWDQETFVGLISAKQAELKHAQGLRRDAANGLRTVAVALEAEREQLRCIFSTAKRLLTEEEIQSIAIHGKAIGDLVARLDAPLPVEAALTALGDVDALSGLGILKSVRTAVEAVPEATPDAAARGYLVTSQERFSNLKTTE